MFFRRRRTRLLFLPPVRVLRKFAESPSPVVARRPFPIWHTTRSMTAWRLPNRWTRFWRTITLMSHRAPSRWSRSSQFIIIRLIMSSSSSSIITIHIRMLLLTRVPRFRRRKPQSLVVRKFVGILIRKGRLLHPTRGICSLCLSQTAVDWSVSGSVAQQIAVNANCRVWECTDVEWSIEIVLYGGFGPSQANK